MERDRFQFLKSFADTIESVAKADEQLAGKLCMKIINYGINGIDEDSGNAMVEALFIQIKIMIDKGNEISEKRRNANKQRTKINKKGTKKNKQLTNNEQTMLKDKKENIKNNILLISNDINTEAKASEYGNEEINKCLELIASYNGGLIDGTKQNQRRYSKLLIDKLNKLESIKEGKYTWYDTLEIILKVISQNKYYSSKITSPENIYRNLSVLMQQCRNDVVKKASSQTILPVL